MILKKNRVRSLLTYPGGKSKALKHIFPYIPDNIKQIHSPFLGGGSIEVTLASAGVQVHASDIFEPLINFWQCVLDDPNRITNIVKKYYPINREEFYNFKNTFNLIECKFEKAAVFLILNWTSFSGMTLSGGFRHDNTSNFNPHRIKKINNFKLNNLTVKNLSFKESLKNTGDDLIYLDPPYILKNGNRLYGNKGNTHKNFDHKELCKILKTKNNFILSYNNTPEILEMYKEYNIYKPKWYYNMSIGRPSIPSNELLIVTDNISKYYNRLFL